MAAGYLKWKVTDAITVQNMAYYFHADRRWINAENYTYNPQSGRIERDRFFVYHEQALWGIRPARPSTSASQG